jgi:hypothetical protein
MGPDTRSPLRVQICLVPPGRLERPHPAPEAGALSAELWGPAGSLCSWLSLVYHRPAGSIKECRG